MPRLPHTRKQQSVDHYAELGLPSVDASSDEIKRRYRQLALEHHPDKQPPERRAAATAKIARVNSAYYVLGDADRRRIYDMQRESEGGAAAGGAANAKGPLPLLRRHVLGAEVRSFPWSSGIQYLHQHSEGRLHRAMQQRTPILLFVHIGGSARSAKSVPAFVEAHRWLRGGAFFLAAVDAVAQPKLARMLQPADGSAQDLPITLLIGEDRGAQKFDAPLNGTELIEAASAHGIWTPHRPSPCLHRPDCTHGDVADHP